MVSQGGSEAYQGPRSCRFVEKYSITSNHGCAVGRHTAHIRVHVKEATVRDGITAKQPGRASSTAIDVKSGLGTFAAGTFGTDLRTSCASGVTYTNSLQ